MYYDKFDENVYIKEQYDINKPIWNIRQIE